MTTAFADPALPFGHSARTEEFSTFGMIRIRIRCPMCDLNGNVEGRSADMIRGVASAIVAEHMRQTERADG